MAAAWVAEELQGVDLGDERLNKRLNEVISNLSRMPGASIPTGCGGYAETTAAYRMCDNPKVTFQGVLAPHIEASFRRMATEQKVILGQDTTELDLTRPQQQVAGAGSLDGSSRRGMFLHSLMGFTPNGTPLGMVAAQVWAREETVEATKAEREKNRKQTPIEAKESQRWIDMVRQAKDLAQRVPETHFICVADSEADIFELLVEGQSMPEGLDWIIRGCQDRALIERRDGAPDATGQTQAYMHLRERIMHEPVQFSQSITVRAREPKIQGETRERRRVRVARTTDVEVRATTVELRAPWRFDRTLPNITVNAVLVREVAPPAGEPPIEWILLTSLPIDTIEQIREVIALYCVRWMMEIFFRTLKSGCRIEHRRFEHTDRLIPWLAVYLIITWRTLYVCRLGRECP